MWLHKRLTQGKRQKPVSTSSSSSTDRVTRMATLNHYWDNIPIKPIIFRVPAYSTLNKIFEYFCTETISPLHQKIYLRHLQPILLHFPPRESFLKQIVRMLEEEYILISCTPQQRWDLLLCNSPDAYHGADKPLYCPHVSTEMEIPLLFFPVKGSSIELIR